MSTPMQDLMRSAADVTNVVEACNMEGRQERLEGMLSQLEMCEKALQVCDGAGMHHACRDGIGNPWALSAMCKHA